MEAVLPQIQENGTSLVRRIWCGMGIGGRSHAARVGIKRLVEVVAIDMDGHGGGIAMIPLPGHVRGQIVCVANIRGYPGLVEDRARVEVPNRMSNDDLHVVEPIKSSRVI